MQGQKDRELPYNDFAEVAQAIWAEKNLEAKKALVLERVIGQFKFPGKAEKFIRDVQMATSAKLDKMVADLVLLQSGDRVYVAGRR